MTFGSSAESTWTFSGEVAAPAAGESTESVDSSIEDDKAKASSFAAKVAQRAKSESRASATSRPTSTGSRTAVTPVHHIFSARPLIWPVARSFGDSDMLGNLHGSAKKETRLSGSRHARLNTLGGLGGRSSPHTCKHNSHIMRDPYMLADLHGLNKRVGFGCSAHESAGAALIMYLKHPPSVGDYCGSAYVLNTPAHLAGPGPILHFGRFGHQVHV